MTAPAERYTPSKPGDSAVLDLMSLDDKLTAAFGPSDPATDAWVEASLLIGTATYGMDGGR